MTTKREIQNCADKITDAVLTLTLCTKAPGVTSPSAVTTAIIRVIRTLESVTPPLAIAAICGLREDN